MDVIIASPCNLILFEVSTGFELAAKSRLLLDHEPKTIEDLLGPCCKSEVSDFEYRCRHWYRATFL
jgi:hypothetical protein